MTDDLMALADALHDSGTAVPVVSPTSASVADSEGRTGGFRSAPGAVPLTPQAGDGPPKPGHPGPPKPTPFPPPPKAA